MSLPVQTFYKGLYIYATQNGCLCFCIRKLIHDFFSVDLQKRAADMFGMEATLFVPTATMSNLIAGEIAE